MVLDGSENTSCSESADVSCAKSCAAFVPLAAGVITRQTKTNKQVRAVSSYLFLQRGPIPFLIFAPTPWRLVTESQGVAAVEICPDETGHPFELELCHQWTLADALCFHRRFNTLLSCSISI